ncbi:hypothetical protein PDN92_30145, partial [Escherichia coli]|nr:hypothetical protein [Escherichia coli]
MLPSETMIWQPEFTDKTLSRKPGAVHGVYRDARAHTDSQVTAVRDELSRDIIAGTSAAVAYTDASSLA